MNDASAASRGRAPSGAPADERPAPAHEDQICDEPVVRLGQEDQVIPPVDGRVVEYSPKGIDAHRND